jgi:hypothetical protein
LRREDLGRILVSVLPVQNVAGRVVEHPMPDERLPDYGAFNNMALHFFLRKD